jgi:adenine deaminase
VSRVLEKQKDARKLIDTAFGNHPADLVIRDGVLMDVYTGRMLPHRSVAMVDEWIAYVGSDADHTIGKDTRVIEAGGRTICPGFIDAHTHLITYWNIADFLTYAIPCGVTTFFTEMESQAFVQGVKGVEAVLDQIGNRPVKMFALIPPMVSPSPSSDALHITREQLAVLLKDPRVMGLGESFWQGAILDRDNRVLDLMQDTLAAGKSVEGHSAGAFGRKLAAYSAAGAESCHESISTEDVISRLELGLYAMIREGDIRRDLDIILPLKDKIDFRRVILVTDGSNPSDLIKRGYMNDVVQKAVDLGLEPIEAVRMVTLNPAEHFGLGNQIGGISPGRYGDLLLLPEPGIMKPDLVISKGRIVAENGKTSVLIPEVPYPEIFRNTVKMTPISATDLRIPDSFLGTDGMVRTIDIESVGLVTREGRAAPRILDGQLTCDPEKDLLKIVFIERVTGTGLKFTGFVRGWGQKKGAVATTLCWDAGGIIGIGANDKDLAKAVNRLIEIQGGVTLFEDGRLLSELPLRVGGYISELKVPEIAERLGKFQESVAALGGTMHFAHLTMNVMTTGAIPFIRMTEKGYYRFRENDIVEL